MEDTFGLFSILFAVSFMEQSHEISTFLTRSFRHVNGQSVRFRNPMQDENNICFGIAAAKIEPPVRCSYALIKCKQYPSYGNTMTNQFLVLESQYLLHHTDEISPPSTRAPALINVLLHFLPGILRQRTIANGRLGIDLVKIFHRWMDGYRANQKTLCRSLLRNVTLSGANNKL